jgi:hypothetical protein
MASVQVAASVAQPPEYDQARALIDQALALIPQPERQIDKVSLVLDKIIPLVQSIPEAGASNKLRYRVYSLIQAQKNDDGAFYKELKCPIHLDLLGDAGPATTLPCGHSFCIGCIGPIVQGPISARKCPECRAVIQPGTQLNPTFSIGLITDRLKPRAGGSRKKRTKTMKYRRNMKYI